MLPFLVNDFELEKDFVSPLLDLRHVPVERVVDGVRVKCLEPKLADVNELAKYSARDFQLQEILESGSFDLLLPVPLIQLNRTSSLDLAERSSVALDEYISRYSENVVKPDVEPVKE